MNREFIFCVVTAACFAQIITVGCLPDGDRGREREDVRSEIPDVQTMRVGQAKQLLGTDGQQSLNIPTTAGNADDSTVVGKSAFEKLQEEFTSIPTTKTQVDQDSGLSATLKVQEKNTGSRMSPAPEGSLLQAMAKFEEIKGQGQEHINVDRTESVTVDKNVPLNAKTNDYVSAMKSEDQSHTISTESPPRGNPGGNVVTNTTVAHEGVKDVPYYDGVNDMPYYKGVREMPTHEEVKTLLNGHELTEIANHNQLKVIANLAGSSEVPSRHHINKLYNSATKRGMPKHEAVRAKPNFEAISTMSNQETVKEFSNQDEGRGKHNQAVTGIPNDEVIKTIPGHGDVREMGVNWKPNHAVTGIPNDEEIKTIPGQGEVRGMPVLEVKWKPNHEAIRGIPNHNIVRDHSSGKESNDTLESIILPQLLGIDGSTGDVGIESKFQKPAPGEREISWILRVQQIVFDGGEDELQQALKTTNRKTQLGENIASPNKDGLDVFREMTARDSRRRLMAFNDKDTPDGSNAAGKETEKDKSSSSSDSPDAPADGTDETAAGKSNPDAAADGTDEVAAGKSNPDSSSLDSTIPKAFKTMTDKGDAPSAQDQPVGKAYGSNDMQYYPFRQDLQNDGGAPSNLKLPPDFFSKEGINSRVEDGMPSVKHNYMVDLFKDRTAENPEPDYGNKNDDDGSDDDNFNALIRGGEDDQRAFKSSQEARLIKRSLHRVPNEFDASVNNINIESANDFADSKLYKRSVNDLSGDSDAPDTVDNGGAISDSQNAGLYKRSVDALPHEFGESLKRENDGSAITSQHSRLLKRSAQHMAGDIEEPVKDDNAGAVKASRNSRLRKRSVHNLPGDYKASPNDDNADIPNDTSDFRVHKRSAPKLTADYGLIVHDDNDGTAKDSAPSRIHKRSVEDMTGDLDMPVKDDDDGSVTDSPDTRLFKRSVPDMPDEVSESVSEKLGPAKSSSHSRLHKRSADDVSSGFDVPVNDDNDGSVKDSQDVRLFKRSVADMPDDVSDSIKSDNAVSAIMASQNYRIHKRSVHDVPEEFPNNFNDRSVKDSLDAKVYKRSVPVTGESINDNNAGYAKAFRKSRLHKRHALDLPRDYIASPNADNEENLQDASDSRLYERSVPDDNTQNGKVASDFRLFKRSVHDLIQSDDNSVNDGNKETPKDRSDPRALKRSVEDVSGKYGVSVNDDEDSPKEYDIEIENGVKHARFPTEENPLLVKREASNSGSETFDSGHQHHVPERENQHRINNTWVEEEVKEGKNSDNNKIHHVENTGKIFVNSEGTPTLVGLVLIPVNSDGTIKEDKESDSSSNAQYHHPGNHHRRPCNDSHGHHGPSHNAEHTAGEGNTHPCHHGHRKGHHNRHKPMEHHVVGRTDSQPAPGYNHDSHGSEEQHPDSHLEKHTLGGHQQSAHRGEYEKERSHSESSGGGFHNRDGESHSSKSRSGEHSRRREEMIVESIRTEQMTSGHAQRSGRAGSAVHVLVILSVFLICFTVILFLIVRSRSGGHVREINSRTALYVPQAKY